MIIWDVLVCGTHRRRRMTQMSPLGATKMQKTETNVPNQAPSSPQRYAKVGSLTIK